MTERPPIDVDDVVSRVGGDIRLEVVTSTGSTNADLLAAAADGAPAWTVLVADLQTAGRGRRDRVWTSPPRAGLTVSVLLRPEPEPPWQLTWVPLLTGVAVQSALKTLGFDDVTLKWPNDVLLDGRKVAGILTQATRSAVVVGIGLNVSTTADELPHAAATSLRLARPDLRVERGDVLVAVLDQLDARTRGLGDPDTARRTYLEVCGTVGQQVLVTPVAGEPYRATVIDVDAHGALVLDGTSGRHTLSAGDVQTLRASTG